MILGLRTAAACLGLFLFVAAGDTPQEILDSVRKKYDSVTDAELKFVVLTRFAMAKIEQHDGGTLYLKKEHKYRIEMEEQTVVTDGATVWSYSVPNKQVLIDKVKKDERTISPEQILMGAPGDFTSTLVGRGNVGKVKTVILKLVPHREQSLISTLRLWIDPAEWLIRRAEVVDVNGKETTYTVTEYRLNPGLSDERFTMKIPEGVEVVDLR